MPLLRKKNRIYRYEGKLFSKYYIFNGVHGMHGQIAETIREVCGYGYQLGMESFVLDSFETANSSKISSQPFTSCHY